MKLIIVAVGHRMPAWVDTGFDEFARRMPRELPLELVEIKAEPRTSGKPPAAMMEAEATRIKTALPARCTRVILDEHGTDLTSIALAQKLETWQGGGEDIVFIIGGPDGLDPALKASAHETLRLSSLTLPHALVRPLLAEALYRAWSITRHHPYHRE
jgi:23S rRNA (pseudouridine1915-N3)-methyltransferase